MKTISILVISVGFTMGAFAQMQNSTAGSTAPATTAKAKQRPMTVNSRQVRQQNRIKEGVQSGELTKKETMKLEARETKIRKEEHRMRSDGQLTGKEKAKLEHDLNKTNRAIKKQKHDPQSH